MEVTGRNKKCLFLSGFRTVVRKKDMTIKPAKRVFSDGNLIFCFIYKLSGIQAGDLISGIKMDAYPYEHSPKRKVIPAAYL